MNLTLKKVILFLAIPFLLVSSTFYIALFAFPVEVDGYTLKVNIYTNESKNMTLDSAFIILSKNGSWELTNTSYQGAKAIMIQNPHLPRIQLFLKKNQYLKMDGNISYLEPGIFVSENGDYEIEMAKEEAIRVFEALGIRISQKEVYIDDNDFSIMYSRAVVYRTAFALLLASLLSYLTLFAFKKGSLFHFLVDDKKEAIVPTVCIFIGFFFIYLSAYLFINPSLILVLGVGCIPLYLVIAVPFLYVGLLRYSSW